MPRLYLRLSVSPTFIAIDAALTSRVLPSRALLRSSVASPPVEPAASDGATRTCRWSLTPLLASLFFILLLRPRQSQIPSSNPCPLCGHSTPHFCYCWPCPLSRPFPTVLPSTLVPPIIQLTPPTQRPHNTLLIWYPVPPLYPLLPATTLPPTQPWPLLPFPNTYINAHTAHTRLSTHPCPALPAPTLPVHVILPVLLLVLNALRPVPYPGSVLPPSIPCIFSLNTFITPS